MSGEEFQTDVWSVGGSSTYHVIATSSDGDKWIVAETPYLAVAAYIVRMHQSQLAPRPESEGIARARPASATAAPELENRHTARGGSGTSPPQTGS